MPGQTARQCQVGPQTQEISVPAWDQTALQDSFPQWYSEIPKAVIDYNLLIGEIRSPQQSEELESSVSVIGRTVPQEGGSRIQPLWVCGISTSPETVL
ncbi:unnamed protein product [Arctogadus glacialis]